MAGMDIRASHETKTAPRAVYVPCRVCGAERTAYDVVKGGGVRCYPCRLARLAELLERPNGPEKEDRRRRPRRDSDRERRAKELFQAGYTLQQIGTVFGVSRERIRQILKRNGIVGKHGGVAARAGMRKAARENRISAQREARAARDFGCDWKTLIDLNDGKLPFSKGSKANRFFHQRRNAHRREIEWLMTFPEWIQLWLDSGKWEQRGKGADKYVMARKQDFGPYAPWNVYITTHSQNVADYQAELKRRGVKCSDGYKRLPEQAAPFEAASHA